LLDSLLQEIFHHSIGKRVQTTRLFLSHEYRVKILLTMTDSILPTSTTKRCVGITVSISIVIGIVMILACIFESYHEISEGNVGIYFRQGAILDIVSDPGVHFKTPFIDDYKEVKIRPETHTLKPMEAVTKDGITNSFREVNVITRVTKEKLVFLIKKFGIDFKQYLVFDRIKEDLRIFCANHTIDEVYNSMFLDIVQHVKDNVEINIRRLTARPSDNLETENGIEILNLVIPKPDIPEDIAQNYKQVKVQWTEQLVAAQQQKTEKIKKETELLKAVADAERQKEVLEINIQQRIIEEEGAKNVSLINNEIKKAAEQNEADILKYKLEKEAEANNALYTDNYIKLNLAKTLSNNTKFYFSGQQSELGGLFSKIMGI